MNHHINNPDNSRDDLHNIMVRWGQSVSYHEFEYVLGDLNHITVSDGYHPLILALREQKFEEHLLLQYFESKNINIPSGFSRYYLDIIFRKPDGAATKL